MKKNALSILVSLIAVSFMFSVVGCKDLKVDNLTANYHLQKGNSAYKDEKYRKAIDEYLTALELNPELTQLYVYIGTAYSSLYRPMKEDERNVEYGEKAIEYLQKAREAYPEKDEIVIALGDIHDKKGNFEECEKMYKLIMDKDPDNPKSYYILADFYTKYNKSEMAEDMYNQRIALDNKAPEGYYYLASWAGQRRQWEKSVENHEKRIYAMVDPDILMVKIDIDQLVADIDKAEKITKNMDTVRKHKRLPQEEKDRLLGEAQEKLDKLRPLEEMKTTLADKEKELAAKLEGLEAKIDAITDEKLKADVAVAYYTLGNVCWNKSFQTAENMMSTEERKAAVDKGLEACRIASKIDKENPDILIYVGLLWREMVKVNPMKSAEFLAKAKEMQEKSKELREKKYRKEQLEKQLEQMGKAD